MNWCSTPQRCFRILNKDVIDPENPNECLKENSVHSTQTQQGILIKQLLISDIRDEFNRFMNPEDGLENPSKASRQQIQNLTKQSVTYWYANPDAHYEASNKHAHKHSKMYLWCYGAPVFHVLPKGSTRIVTTEKVDIDKHTHMRDKIQNDPQPSMLLLRTNNKSTKKHHYMIRIKKNEV